MAEKAQRVVRRDEIKENEESDQPLDIKEKRKRFIGLLGDISVEARYLQTSLSNISSGYSPETLNQQALREKDFAVTKEAFNLSKERIDKRLESISSFINFDGDSYAYYGIDVHHIVNLWDRICLEWEAMSEKDKQLQERRAEKILSLLDEVIYHSNLVTIIHHVKWNFETLRVGQALDFHQTFADRMPLSDDKGQIHEQSYKILRYIHSHPRAVDGIVDLENGKIYKASPNLRRQVLSSFLIISLFVIGAVFFNYVLPFLDSYFDMNFLPANADEFLLETYVFVMAGAGAHVVVDALKQFRAKKGSGVVALEDCAMWIHIKEIPLLAGVLSLYIVSLILLLSDMNGWEVSFFAGYGADSIIDIFLQRFASAAPMKIPFQGL